MRHTVKRLFDIALSASALAVLALPLLTIYLIVRIWLGAPALFVQERPGMKGRVFRLVKFRTMTDARDASGNLLPDKERIHPLGNFLRSTSLDELPELWNVLRGDMSIVGPRPLLVQYLPLYNERQARRHEVRPGLTGLAQVKGRNALSWEERFELDVYYVEHQSLLLDLKIILLTIHTVFSRNGISGEGSVTMPHFTGTRKDALPPKPLP